jgi:hypothetical protein
VMADAPEVDLRAWGRRRSAQKRKTRSRQLCDPSVQSDRPRTSTACMVAGPDDSRMSARRTVSSAFEPLPFSTYVASTATFSGLRYL